jgi:hypothetical protein
MPSNLRCPSIFSFWAQNDLGILTSILMETSKTYPKLTDELVFIHILLFPLRALSFYALHPLEFGGRSDLADFLHFEPKLPLRTGLVSLFPIGETG